jgi:hypothetical protein
MFAAEPSPELVVDKKSRFPEPVEETVWAGQVGLQFTLVKSFC